MTKFLIISILSLYAVSSFAFCKINRFGHNICENEKALYTEGAPAGIQNKNQNLIKHYIPVTVTDIHVHEPYVIIKGGAIKSKKRVHVDFVFGNKLCRDSNICKGDKVVIKKECRGNKDNKVFKVTKVYEDDQFKEDLIEIKRGSIFKKRRVFKESCLHAGEHLEN